MSNVIFQDLCHKAVDTTAHVRQKHQYVSTVGEGSYSPEPRRLCLARAWRQQRFRSIVDMQLRRAEYMAAKLIDQWTE